MLTEGEHPGKVQDQRDEAANHKGSHWMQRKQNKRKNNPPTAECAYLFSIFPRNHSKVQWNYTTEKENLTGKLSIDCNCPQRLRRAER